MYVSMVCYSVKSEIDAIIFCCCCCFVFFFFKKKGEEEKGEILLALKKSVKMTLFYLVPWLFLKISNFCQLFLYYSCALYRSFSEIIHIENIPYVSETSQRMCGKMQHEWRYFRTSYNEYVTPDFVPSVKVLGSTPDTQTPKRPSLAHSFFSYIKSLLLKPQHYTGKVFCHSRKLLILPIIIY